MRNWSLRSRLCGRRRNHGGACDSAPLFHGMDAMINETYLGDGLYASFDGWSFTLRAPREGGDHEVMLEPAVLDAFEQFVGQVRRNLEARDEPVGEPVL